MIYRKHNRNCIRNQYNEKKENEKDNMISDTESWGKNAENKT